MNLIELNRALRQLRLGGIAAVLEMRLHQAQVESMTPIDLISCLVSDELTRLMEKYDSLQITVSMIVLGTIFLMLWVMWSQPWRFRFSPGTWTALAVQGLFATAAAYLLWNWGLARVPASRAGVFLNLDPLTGALPGVFVLHETLGITAILGGAMIIGSAVYFSWPTKAEVIA
jgi:drug/metabolite transporter (DMT)-like permease